ncbi:hypothetical protein [Variovorax boronicumulans]|uniref:hypothetical protein n=1 Tax=Variovorax boronicumulans TaxID=436515 RepID=UPI001C56F655
MSEPTISTPSAPAALRVVGILPTPQALAWADIAALPRREVGPLAVVCMTGRQVRAERTYAGPLLKDLLAHCGLAGLPRPRLKQSLVLCRAADGYRAIFTWHELFNTRVGEGVLVVQERGGESAGEAADERLTLISAEDLRGGPRNLQRLVSVELAVLPGEGGLSALPSGPGSAGRT